MCCCPCHEAHRKGGQVFDYRDCTCVGMWHSILPPPPCPIHGSSVIHITCTTDTYPVNQ